MAMPMTYDDVQAECRAALADADLAAEQVRFFPRRKLGQDHAKDRPRGGFRPPETGG